MDRRGVMTAEEFGLMAVVWLFGLTIGAGGMVWLLDATGALA